MIVCILVMSAPYLGAGARDTGQTVAAWAGGMLCTLGLYGTRSRGVMEGICKVISGGMALACETYGIRAGQGRHSGVGYRLSTGFIAINVLE